MRACDRERVQTYGNLKALRAMQIVCLNVGGGPYDLKACFILRRKAQGGERPPLPFLLPAALPLPAAARGGGGDRWGGDRDRGYGGDRGGDRPRGVCFDWQKGRCDRGESCRFAHEGEQRA